MASAGSSPLTRGKRSSPKGPRDRLRLIPAHAGKTRRGCFRRGRSGAHPRSRGENFISQGQRLRGTGSSPLTRGKHTRLHVHDLPAGLIPAHAGKTTSSVMLISMIWAHPRSRGENPFGVGHRGGDIGSSPLTRGKQVLSESHTACLGLIPAHAGKTSAVARLSNSSRAHPRSRGENERVDFGGGVEVGSSPLTRGKLVLPGNGETELGLIPAHAGKT